MTTGKDLLFRWVRHPDGGRLESVGIFADGTLHNPRGYPERDVREAVLAAVERRKARRSAAATKAARTRAGRREHLVHQIARRIAGHRFEAGVHCAVCRRALTDPASQARGVGPECWEDVVCALEAIRMTQEVKP